MNKEFKVTQELLNLAHSQCSPSTNPSLNPIIDVNTDFVDPEFAFEVDEAGNLIHYPKCATDGSNGIDLFVREDTVVPCNPQIKGITEVLEDMLNMFDEVTPTNTDLAAVNKKIQAIKQAKQIPTKVPLNIRLSYPKGYFAYLMPRSSLSMKKLCFEANSIGLIDYDFKNEHCALLLNFGNEDVVLKKGERIAQLIFFKYNPMRLVYNPNSVPLDGKHNGTTTNIDSTGSTGGYKN